jgi:hypothetical protein
MKFFIMGLFFLISCENDAHRNKSQSASAQPKAKYTGFDIRGEQMSCTIPEPEMACPELWRIPMDDFALACKDQGAKVFKCDCDNYLCSKKLDFKPAGDGEKVYLEGYTLRGEWRRCPKPAEELVCPAIYGPEEEFDEACKKAGFSSAMCGCSSYLCSTNILSSSEQKDSILQLAGTQVSISKEGMLGNLYEIKVDVKAKTISGTADLDGSIGEDPYILPDKVKAYSIEDRYWVLLENAMRQTRFTQLEDSKCEVKANISDHPIRKITNLKTNKIFAEKYQRNPYLCIEYSREFEFLQASLGAIFILSGAKQKISKNCNMAIVPMIHPSTEITVEAVDGCMAAALAMWGYKPKENRND